MFVVIASNALMHLEYDKFLSNVNPTDSDSILQFFTNEVDLSHADVDMSDEDSFQKFLELSAYYVDALVHKGRYNKALDFLEEVDGILKQGALRFLPENELESNPYNAILWNRSIANFRLKKYYDASLGFRRLLKNDPDNDKLKEWLRLCVAWYEDRVANVLLIVATVCFGCHYLLKVHLSRALDNFLSFTGLLLYLISLILYLRGQIQKRNRKKS